MRKDDNEMSTPFGLCLGAIRIRHSIPKHLLRLFSTLSVEDYDAVECGFRALQFEEMDGIVIALRNRANHEEIRELERAFHADETIDIRGGVRVKV